MKITVNQLRRIIKEEVSRVLKENPVQGPGMSLKAGQEVETKKPVNARTEGDNPVTLPKGVYKIAMLMGDDALVYVSSKSKSKTKIRGQELARFVNQSDLLDAMAMEEMV